MSSNIRVYTTALKVKNLLVTMSYLTFLLEDGSNSSIEQFVSYNIKTDHTKLIQNYIIRFQLQSDQSNRVYRVKQAVIRNY